MTPPTGKVVPRPVQTQVKHTILEQYLKSWGGIILNGLRGIATQKRINTEFVYVDGFASVGRYDGETSDAVAAHPGPTVWGSPIIGVHTVDMLERMADNYHIGFKATYILIEENRLAHSELLKSLERAGLSSRIKLNPLLSSLRAGDIAVFNADARQMSNDLVGYTQRRYCKAFYFLDPWGCKGIPLTFVGQIVKQEGHDAMIYMPYNDLLRRTGSVDKIELSQTEEALLKNYDAMFGNGSWRQIGSDIERAQQNEQKYDSKEIDLVNCYKESLMSVDPRLIVKSIHLRFEDVDRTLYHLYLTTHNVDGALAMNSVLYKAGYQEYVLRWKFEDAKLAGERGQLSMFEPHELVDSKSRPSIESIARHIQKNHGGQSVELQQVCVALVESTYFRDEIATAIRKLRSEGLVTYTGALKNTAKITFK